ncbi:hypothetical protein ATANTOWER_015025 [Ataeniobius toweri]|uniref:Uncharacterized protein n=1 Tax=Ataeniobius toweri TaxID=208326 RepID=A0ABU7CBA6_9TELE|nr:hypothetical protein [Ataeniobius toweri]
MLQKLPDNTITPTTMTPDGELRCQNELRCRFMSLNRFPTDGKIRALAARSDSCSPSLTQQGYLPNQRHSLETDGKSTSRQGKRCLISASLPKLNDYSIPTLIPEDTAKQTCLYMM